MSKTIYISPSNQTANVYTGVNTTEEKECHAIGELLKEELRQQGYLPTLAARGSSIRTRVADANAMKADLYITIHTNAGGGTGAEVYYYNHPASIKACQAVYDELRKIIPSTRGLKDGTKDFYEIFATNMVSVYPEIGFHDRKEEAIWISGNKPAIAQALCKGICKYFGTTYLPPKEPQPEKGTAISLDELKVLLKKEGYESITL